MGRLTFIISVILLFQVVGFGQDVCVELKTESNEDAFPTGQTILFKAILNEKLKTENLKFIWKTSNGISKTQNSDIFYLEAKKDSKYESVKISLEVEGLPNNCLKSYEKTVSIIPPPPPIHDPDWLHQSSLLIWNDEKLRLSSYAKELKEQENATLYIIIRARNPKSKKILIRQQKIKNFLTKTQKIDREKFNVIVAKSESENERTEYWVVPDGAKPPDN